MSGNREDAPANEDTSLDAVLDDLVSEAHTSLGRAVAAQTATDPSLYQAEDASLDVLLATMTAALDCAIEVRSRIATPGLAPLPDPAPVHVNWEEALGDQSPPWLWPASARMRRRAALLQLAGHFGSYQGSADIAAEEAHHVRERLQELQHVMEQAKDSESSRAAAERWTQASKLSNNLLSLTNQASGAYRELSRSLRNNRVLSLPRRDGGEISAIASADDVRRMVRELREEDNLRDERRYAHYLNLLHSHETALGKATAHACDYFGGFATALAMTTGLLRGSGRDFCAADLREVVLEAVPLEGVCWNPDTLWPGAWRERINHASVPVGGGRYMILAEPASAPVRAEV